jgi:hypothetical protein
VGGVHRVHGKVTNGKVPMPHGKGRGIVGMVKVAHGRVEKVLIPGGTFLNPREAKQKERVTNRERGKAVGGEDAVRGAGALFLGK